jgi:adenylate kinase
MRIALTGTPGTGKTAVAALLRQNQCNVIDVNKIAFEHNFIIGKDDQRDTMILDTEQVNCYINQKYKTTREHVFFEGHITHLLKTMDKVIILRCHPKALRKRLSNKGWKPIKIQENVEAEALDVILCEAAELHDTENLFEIDTTNRSIEAVTASILELVNLNFKPMKKYNIGYIDWSEELLKE